MDFLLFIKDLRLKNKVYCEVWLNILMQYNDEDTKTINIYPSLIWNVVNGHQKSTKGFVFKPLENL